MSDERRDDGELRFETRAIHVGQDPEASSAP